MTTITVDIAKIQKIASRWRSTNGYTDKGGVIILHEKKVQGWVNKLRNPESWMPGCIAVKENGDCYVAQGGNRYDGAERWTQL